MARIYTKGGDRGETGLIGGVRVPKDHARVAAYGDVDELNAHVGLAVAQLQDGATKVLLRRIQRDLFAVGAHLADPSGDATATKPKAELGSSHIERLEAEIDERDGRLPALTAFVLPGGDAAAPWLHLARTACRRAERSIVTLSRAAHVDPAVLIYVNRLADLLFVLAREEHHRAGGVDEPW